MAFNQKEGVIKKNKSRIKISIFSFFIASLVLCTHNAFAVTIQVPGDYATIQDAMSEANSGDNVQVAAGTYYANLGDNIYLKSGVALRGEGADVTTIRGVVIGADNSTIEGFTINSYHGTAILCDAASPSIQNCTFTENRMVLNLE